MKKLKVFGVVLLSVMFSVSCKGKNQEGKPQKEISVSDVEPVVDTSTQNVIELFDLVNMFIPDKNDDYTNLRWSTGANKNSPINWKTNGIDYFETYYFREGAVCITINGESLECLDKYVEPCEWNLKLIGNKGGYSSFHLDITHFEVNASMTIEEMFSNENIESKLIKECDEASYGHRYYSIKFKNKREFWMHQTWSCGSGGCHIYLDFFLNKYDFETDECD